MQSTEIVAHLRNCGIGIDNNTIHHTLNFLNTHIGSLDPQLQIYQIMAAAAIAGETVILDDITNTHRAKTGITLQRVMRHLGSLSKEQYLQVVGRQVGRWREAPLWLKSKIQSLILTYRIYKKYRNVFDQLSAISALLDQKSAFTLMATFWILFLFLKNQHPDFDNTISSTALLHAIVVFAFAEVAAQMPHQRSSAEFRKQFPESKLPAGEEWAEMRGLIVGKLEEIHAHRYDMKPMEVQQLVTNPNYAERYLDDLSNLYEKQMRNLPENTIDQLSFLELNKTLAPQAIRHTFFREPAPAIQTRIDFTKSDDEDEDNQMPLEQPSFVPQPIKIPEKPKEDLRRVPVSPIRPIQGAFRGLATPVSSRHKNLSWVNGIISGKYIEEEAMRVQQLYVRYAKGEYAAYKGKALLCITNAVVQFTPECMDVPRRQRSIYHFFEYFLNRIAQTHIESDLVAILGNDLNINSILCLSCELFNYAYNSLSAPYRTSCHLFGLTLLQGYKPINWFGKHIQMPPDIRQYLYVLERRVLLDELWEESQGYQLLADREELQKYHSQAVLKRLQRHCGERVEELCNKLKAGEKDISLVINLVRLIMDKQVQLLRHHRIDQIIVCAIASVLSLNHSPSRLSLDDIFQHYTSLALSYNANRHSLYDSSGLQIGLLPFYNDIFLPAVQHLLNSEEHADFLATPHRLQHSRNRRLGLEMSPITARFRQPPAIILPPRLSLHSADSLEKEKERRESEYGKTNSYRYELASSLKNLDEFPSEKEQQEQSQQQVPSPTFGGRPDIYRTYSFGDRTDLA